jgi:hypothetical protein
MVTIHLNGRITEAGELQVDLPEGLPPGDVQVTIEVLQAKAEPPLTDEELAELLKPITPKTGAEIAADIEAGLIGDGWADIQISGAEWVEQQRRKHRKKYQW